MTSPLALSMASIGRTALLRGTARAPQLRAISTTVPCYTAGSDASPARAHRPRDAPQQTSQHLSKGANVNPKAEKTYNEAYALAGDIAQSIGVGPMPGQTPDAAVPPTGAGLAHANPPPAAPSSGHASPPSLASEPLITTTYAPFALPVRADPLLAFFTNLIMKEGKKASAERTVSTMLAHIRNATNSTPLPIVQRAVELTAPLVRMQTRKTGGKSVQVPMALNERQRTRRALTWIIDASAKRPDREFAKRLAAEFLAVVDGQSGVLGRREEAHKVAMMNRANASVRI